MDAELIERVRYTVDAPTGQDFLQRKAGLTRHDMRRILQALRTHSEQAGEVDRLRRANVEAIALIDEINERATSREFHGINQPLHAKLCTVRAALSRASTPPVESEPSTDLQSADDGLHETGGSLKAEREIMRPGGRPTFVPVESAPTADALERDMETLIRDLQSAGEWEDEHEEILTRWRKRKGEAGMGEWRWWWKLPSDELYQTDHTSREDAVAAAAKDEPTATLVEVIEARSWADDIDVENQMFAMTRNHAALSLPAQREG